MHETTIPRSSSATPCPVARDGRADHPTADGTVARRITDSRKRIPTNEHGAQVPCVLIVDDDPDLRELAAEVLAQEGWTVVKACSGDDACMRAKADPPDAILLDVMMPGPDGFATLQALRADPATRPVPVIFMSARPDLDECDLHRRHGAAGLISKPFEAFRLASLISTKVGWATTR